jgi:hypothetical protein
VISGGTGSGEDVDFKDDAIDNGLQGAGELFSPAEPSSRGATLSVIARDNVPVPANSRGTERVTDLGA